MTLDEAIARCMRTAHVTTGYKKLSCMLLVKWLNELKAIKDGVLGRDGYKVQIWGSYWPVGVRNDDEPRIREAIRQCKEASTVDRVCPKECKEVVVDNPSICDRCRIHNRQLALWLEDLINIRLRRIEQGTWCMSRKKASGIVTWIEGVGFAAI